MTTPRHLVVHPVLHGSGFGNQVGMLLQHVALAAYSGTVLVLPAIQQPPEHRAANEVEGTAAYRLAAEQVFNLSAFAPLARVVDARQLPPSALSLNPLPGETATLPTFSFGLRRRPLRLPAMDGTPTLVAAARLLRAPYAICEEGHRSECEGFASTRGLRPVFYCHLPRCRDHTRRVCKRVAGGCSRPSQRLPNNYLFAHRMASLLCRGGGGSGGGGVGGGGGGGGGGDISAEATSSALERYERLALHHLELSDTVRAAAAPLVRELGDYVALHVRLSDAASPTPSARGVDPTAAMGTAPPFRSKGLSVSDLPVVIARYVRQLTADESRSGEASRPTGRGDGLTLYIASNRPDQVREAMPRISAAVRVSLPTDAFGSGRVPVRLRGWHDFDWAAGGASVHAPMRDPSGLWAALIEHELCVLAPRGFAGSAFSTWANLIGARRLSRGVAPRQAYVDLQSGETVPGCAVGNLTRDFISS